VASRRVSDEPAFVLHRYDWSESSLILEVFTRNHGRVALIAKGAKRPSSSFRPILLPLQEIHVAFGGDAEIRMLKSAEWQGRYMMPQGDALICGYYVNELVLTLLARDDPHPKLFDIYAGIVEVIAADRGELLHAALRTFELLLLREIGLLPMLDAQTMTLTQLDPTLAYCLVPEGGLRLADGNDRAVLNGQQWMALQAALDSNNSLTATLRVCSDFMSALRPQLRRLLHYHCGVPTLRTQQMMMELQSL
jgi:DNA repair protein RecO (recombination protein O)